MRGRWQEVGGNLQWFTGEFSVTERYGGRRGAGEDYGEDDMMPQTGMKAGSHPWE